MNNLIQTIKILNEEELKIINDYIDELTFQENTVFDSNGKSKIDTSVRSSLGSTLNEEHEATKLLHQKINESLLVYKEKVIKNMSSKIVCIMKKEKSNVAFQHEKIYY